MNPHQVHFVYLIPSDRQNRAELRIKEAALNAQCWLRWKMGNNKSFTPSDPVVSAYHTDHTAEWYSTFTEDPRTPHSEWYWANAQRDARDFAGAQFYQWDRTWVIYLDAPTAPDQHAGGASTGNPPTGICVLTGRDTDALCGEDPEWTVCREIGGMVHEYLHTHNVPHPPPGPDFGKSVMGTGYLIYPDCTLLDSEKAMLDVNAFYTLRPNLPVPTELCYFDTRRAQRPPRKRPIPVPRPDCPLNLQIRKANQ